MQTFNTTLGGTPVTIYAPAKGDFDNHEIAMAFFGAFTDGLFGLDVEGTFLDEKKQFSSDFEVFTAQFATEDAAWVLDLEDPDQFRAAVEVLQDPSTKFSSHTNMDVLSAHVRLGVDITYKNVDTRLLSRMADPDATSGHDLKTLTTKYIGPELVDADHKLDQVFMELWRAAGGTGRAKHQKVDDEGKVAENDIARYGWSAIPVTDPTYLTYAGLDAIACRRLVPILVEATKAPKELLDKEMWLATQANRIQIRGMKVDLAALEELWAQATEVTGAARVEMSRLTTAHPITGCRVWESWTEKKRAEGLSPLAPLLKPHRINIRDEFGKPVKKPSGGYENEPCCDGWLAQHGVDWSEWPGPFTDAGAPSMEKDALFLVGNYDLDEVGRKVFDQLVKYREFHDTLNKTKGVRAGLDDEGRSHPILHTVGTVTGRMSSAEPNFQNFSKKNPKMRGMFVPEDGHVFVTADFDQIELRVVAALAREQKMIDTILAGGDLHQLTADEIGIERDLAKMVNFLIVYGGGGPALHQQGGIPLDRAYEIVRSFRERYPAIDAYSDSLSMAQEYVNNIAMRRIPVTVNKKTGKLRSFANINYVVQSSSRELLAHAWYRFAVEFGHADTVWFPVHDELILQVREGEVDQVVADVEKCMRFDFMGVPITASAVPLIDDTGRSRWMTSKLAEKYKEQRELVAA